MLYREEQVFDREEVLGRDACSVFPTESKRMVSMDPEKVKEVLGKDRKFISETELEEIHAARGTRGDVVAQKPLAEILKEQRDAKDAAFQEQWKQMKTGKNRPLEEDELHFLDSLAQAEQQRWKVEIEQEKAELESFRQHREPKSKLHPPLGGATTTQSAVAAVPKRKVPAVITVKPKIKKACKTKEEGDDGGLAGLLGAYGSESD